MRSTILRHVPRPNPLTTPLGSSLHRRRPTGDDGERPAGLQLSLRTQVEDLDHVRGALVDPQFATVEAADDGISPVNAEGAVDLAQLLNYRFPCLVTGGGVGVPPAKPPRPSPASPVATSASSNDS